MSKASASPASVSTSTVQLAVLFAYNGTGFKGFERSIPVGPTVEGDILSALAKLTGQDDPSKKVTSAHIPTPDELNRVLPESIRVFKVSHFQSGFSARRSCDARTYEYLVPTYVFLPPPPETGYAYNFQPDMTREELDLLYPDPALAGGPTGGLFTTIKRNKRKSQLPPSSTTRATPGTPTAPLSIAVPNMERSGSNGMLSPTTMEALPSPPASPRPIPGATNQNIEAQFAMSPGATPSNRFSKFMGNMIRGHRNDDATPVHQSNSNLYFGSSPPAHINTTEAAATTTIQQNIPTSPKSSRRRSQYGTRSRSAPATSRKTDEAALLAEQLQDEEINVLSNALYNHGRIGESESDFKSRRDRQKSPIRSAFNKITGNRERDAGNISPGFVDPRFNNGYFGRKDPFLDHDQDEENTTPTYHDPLNLPLPTDEELESKQEFRISQGQMQMLKYILGMYRGTHNFHNFIPGATHEDKRCYIRILNIECCDPEIHFGMEWIRIKVQSKAFARYQIRRMIALAIQAIRTNTPRNVVSNSFGIQVMTIPESPAIGLIFDEPFYLAYNNQVSSPSYRIAFDQVSDVVEDFRRDSIHEAVYKSELKYMHFDAWLRSVDRYAFLYQHYLNPRGLVLPQTAYVRTSSADDDVSSLIAAQPLPPPV
ncbi:tRNA pseudouridine synthase 1 [Phlyctochytrium planicorne]|nr:tRNA pseudouridine synthase 1 [Phlyctochytrium planicorne]